jgi:hypothetical protein
LGSGEHACSGRIELSLAQPYAGGVRDSVIASKCFARRILHD